MTKENKNEPSFIEDLGELFLAMFAVGLGLASGVAVVGVLVWMVVG